MSTLGYPLMITCHAIGMAIMVGLAVSLDLRLLGRFQGIPYPALHRFLGLAWLGFGINFLSGAALFTTKPMDYVNDYVFMTKITCVLAGAITAALLQTSVGRDSGSWSIVKAPGKVRAIALLSIVFWFTAIVAGRLTAYIMSPIVGT